MLKEMGEEYEELGPVGEEGDHIDPGVMLKKKAKAETVEVTTTDKDLRACLFSNTLADSFEE